MLSSGVIAVENNSIYMIKTKTAVKREARNAKIKELYKKYMPNGMKSAVVEKIAKEAGTSVSTVNRVVKTA